MTELLLQVFRGGSVESAHRGSIAVADAAGRLIAGIGEPDAYIYARSTAKPLQAAAVVASGAADRFCFSPEELALMCASHGGEPEHERTVRSMLEKMGLTPESLECGPQEPFHRESAHRLIRDGVPFSAAHNNCSGKHAGMIALALQLGVPVSAYVSRQHPVQAAMLEAVAEICGVPAERITLGVDGCGVPVFGLPLSSLARGFARWGTGDGLPLPLAEACLRLRRAIADHPFHLAGTGRFDTALIEATGGRLIGKMGAEGVFALAVPEKGIGIAVKIADGAERSLYPVVAETLVQLGLLTEDEQRRLASYRRPPVLNRRGETVGELRPSFELRLPGDWTP
ncbi:asparaginase [Paenibacillus thermoaerophilus]|uniref:Asparaginase n=1 Tax=Paenibacillus thermoaerophilus TaxID=1215385 RepID=A0ABW2V1N3_9BACL|nr:asparaginase [Paenibacillus thermoaerophilus]